MSKAGTDDNGAAQEPAVLIKVHKNDDGAGWGELILNRPARKNAITGPLGVGLAEGLRRLDADRGVQAILFRGAGGAFCSGLDLGAFNANPEPDWLGDFQTIWRSAHRALFECRTPIIGAMQRYAINGGAALALACDYLLVGERAFLQVGEVQIGMAAPYNLAWLNLRHNEAVISELTLIGDRIPGQELVRMGLANRCVDDDDVLDEASALCARMAGFPAGTAALIKSGIRSRLPETADQWFDRYVAAAAGNRVKPRAVQAKS